MMSTQTPPSRRSVLSGVAVAGAGLTLVGLARPTRFADVAIGDEQDSGVGPDPVPLTWGRALKQYRYGVALAGLEFGDEVFPGRLHAEIQPPPADRYAYYASRGIRSIRLPYLWERFQPELFGDIDGTVDLLAKDRARGQVLYKDLIRQQLDLAHAHGMKVLIDPHNYGARALRRRGQWLTDGGTGRLGRFAIGSADVPVAAFADFIGKIAREFGDHPALMGLDIMNEPVSLPNGPDSWFDAAQAAILSARRAAPDVMLFIEGYHYANPFTWLTNNPRLHELSDPSNKLIFSAHLYFDANHSGRYDGAESLAPGIKSNPQRTVEDITPFFSWLNEHGFHGHIGEFGAPNTSGWTDLVGQFIAQCLRRNILMHAWADWPGPTRYSLDLNPQGGPDTAIVKMLSQASRGQ